MGGRMTGKLKACADAYLETLNKTEASRRAKYKGDDATLANIGYQNYRKLQVQEYLKERLDEMALKADEVLAGLSQEATASLALFLKPGSLDLDTEKIHRYGHLIKSLTWTKYGPKIELYDAQAAKVHLGKAHGLFTDKFELSGSIENKLVILPTQEDVSD